jgi:hypothetical protein
MRLAGRSRRRPTLLSFVAVPFPRAAASNTERRIFQRHNLVPMDSTAPTASLRTSGSRPRGCWGHVLYGVNDFAWRASRTLVCELRRLRNWQRALQRHAIAQRAIGRLSHATARAWRSLKSALASLGASVQIQTRIERLPHLTIPPSPSAWIDAYGRNSSPEPSGIRTI